MVLREIENARLLGRAIVGNAFEHLPAPYALYIKQIAKETPTRYNQNGKELILALTKQIDETLPQRVKIENLLSTPWSLRRGERVKIKPSRVAASIIAFTDVQGKHIIEDFFPVAYIQTFLAQVEKQAAIGGQPLTIPEQFALALQITDNNPVAASLLAHGAYRAIGRGKDAKISPDLSFSLEKAMSLARSTADLHTVNSPSRDPLGDTYHWWASFSAGLVFTLAREEHPIQSRLYTTAFYHEAALTTFVRKNVLRKTNLTNHHKDVDRQGLQAGITVGNFLKTK